MSRPTLANHPAVSFTVKRPSALSRETPQSGADASFPVPVSITRPSSKPTPLPPGGGGRRLASNSHDNDDSSDEDAGTEDEIITGFDSFGVQRANEVADKGPLVIPSLANRDWRAAARRRQNSKIFVPDSGKAAVGVGADGSVGGLGTRDTINSGPQISGIVTTRRQKLDTDASTGENSASPPDVNADVAMADFDSRMPPDEELTEDQRALRAILSGDQEDVTQIDIIPNISSSRSAPKTETEAYREDVVTRPDSATLEAYARVPVEQFGKALLLGMGWEEGMAASKTRKGPVEPFVPVRRPALLGIGAKERPVEDTIGANGNRRPQRPEKRYVPVVKRARDGTIVPDDPQASRSASHSPPRREGERDSGGRDREYSRRREDRIDHRDDRYGRREIDSDREQRRRGRDDDDDRQARDKDRDRDRHRERERERGRDSPYHQDRDRDRDRDRERDHSERRERDYDRRGDRDRDRESDRHRSRY